MLRIIDKNTFIFKRDDFVFDPETEIGLDVEPSQGLWLPKWDLDNSRWIEGGTAPLDTRTYAEKLVALIREKYSVDDEFAIINKGILDSNNSEYLTYRAYVNECKAKCK